MLRSFLIYLSKVEWARNIFANWDFAWKAASRFIAGETIDEALTVVKNLNKDGIYATLDQLGENTTSLEEAKFATDGILEILDKIEKLDVKSNVSIKLTQIGLSLNEQVCTENLTKIVQKAKDNNNFIRIDMEDTPYTDQSIKLLRKLREMGYQNIGIVLQSYLYRTEKDTRGLLKEGVTFRLVKGAYDEPAKLAYPKKRDVDDNFDKLAEIMLDGAFEQGEREVLSNGRFPPVTALGTHDSDRIEKAIYYQELKGLPKEALEMQMLYGIRRDLQYQLSGQGYPVRVYVPFGTHWYPYFVRRLAERPANIWFFLSNYYK
ncbi:proline dehydrogenase family protein [Chloroflexota bacterium]